MIAALYVETGGVYYGISDVDPWDETRDARLYDGPHRVVAHPPCQRWCRLDGLIEARWGHRKGADGGTFAHALDCIRRFGGVLEHPAFTKAWRAHDLTAPGKGGWYSADLFGGWACHVEQGRYGHPAKKATWLYAVRCELPSLDWRTVPDQDSEALVSWCGNKVLRHGTRRQLSQQERSASPMAFRDVLLTMARSVR